MQTTSRTSLYLSIWPAIVLIALAVRGTFLDDGPSAVEFAGWTLLFLVPVTAASWLRRRQPPRSTAELLYDTERAVAQTPGKTPGG